MKKLLVILLTFIIGVSSTLGTLWYFKDKLLDLNGLAVIDKPELNKLKQDRQKLHKAKKLVHGHKQTIKARQTKRVAKRVTAATSATLVPYLDTAVVPVIILGMEAQDYCEQQKDLQEVLDVFSGSKTPYNIETCLTDIQQELQESISASSSRAGDVVDAFVDDVKQKSQEVFDSFFGTYLPW